MVSIKIYMQTNVDFPIHSRDAKHENVGLHANKCWFSYSRDVKHENLHAN